MVQPIETPPTLKDYTTATLEELREKHPGRKFYTSMCVSGRRRKAGSWFKLGDGKIVQAVAFDHYAHPLPVHMLGEPQEYRNGVFDIKVWKSKHRRIKRIIYYNVGFVFHDIEEYKWMEKKK